MPLNARLDLLPRDAVTVGVVDQRVLDLALSGSTSFHVLGYDVL